MKLVITLFSSLLFSTTIHAASFESQWTGDRIWIGPEHWANPLQDWRVNAGEVVGLAAYDRTLHLLTHQVTGGSGDLEMEVQVKLDGKMPKKSPEAFVGGFRIGVRGELDNFRHALVQGVTWMDLGLRADGSIVLNDQVSNHKLNANQWIRLRFNAQLSGAKASLKLMAEEVDGEQTATLETTVLADTLLGNVALLANGSDRAADPDGSSWRFRDWSVAGRAVEENKAHRFGPILWTNYTLSRNILKLTALMAPVEGSEAPVRLELKREGSWVEAGSSAVHPMARTAHFRLENWDDTEAVEYRVAYNWEGTDYYWSGTVRKDPRDERSFTLGAFSCDNGYIFPNSRVVENTRIQDPDMLYFAGDQIYESFGGFGKIRSPVDLAMLDYLRKYWMFGWSWREVLKDRPSVILPDDHDVFQGNLWGHGGRSVPNMSENPGGQDFPKGGYVMDPAWVNAVERTQTSHLPDPVDPKPVEQGIGVYFTDINYGGLSFAVVEDRKFKSGPGSFAHEVEGEADVTALTLEGAELLGPRQEAFLRSWIKEDAGDFKVALTQTIFCKVTTHTGRNLNASESGADSNGWPQNKRDLALDILGRDVVMVHGDQHLGALVRHGVDEWEDGPIGFMVPGTANGFPRAWWPEEAGENRKQDDPYWTGRYLDSLGNKMTVLAVANPEKGSNLIPKGAQDPESIGHQKGSGHGLIHFDRKTGNVTFETWRLQFDAANPKPGDQFEGFPKTLKFSTSK